MTEEPIIGATYTRRFVYETDNYQLKLWVDEVIVEGKKEGNWIVFCPQVPVFDRTTFCKDGGAYRYLLSGTKFPVVIEDDGFIKFCTYTLKTLP